MVKLAFGCSRVLFVPESRVLRRIDNAVRDGHLVTVTRRKGWDRLDGSIVASSTKWLLLAVDDGAGFNGHTIIRVLDVRSVVPATNAAFVERALALEGHWPLPRLDPLDLTSTQSVLRTLTDTAPLVTIFYEQDHPDKCLIGVPHDFESRKFRLQTVTPNAEWEAEDTVMRYRSVSRIETGAAYERRLAAGSPPS